MSELTDSGVLLRLALSASTALDIDTEQLYQACRLDPALLKQKDLRTPHGAQRKFWQALEEISQDAFIGLHLAEHMPAYKGHVLQYLFLSSPTFGEGLNRALEYQRLLSDAFAARLEQSSPFKNQCQLVISENSEQLYNLRHFSECVTLALALFFKRITNGRFRPLSISFTHPAPSCTDEYQRLLGCQPEFSAQQNSISFDCQLMTLPSSMAEPEILRVHEQLANEHLSKLEKQGIISKVNRAIGEQLENGNVSLDTVAGRLDLKPRSLRSQLTDASASFNQLLADYRCSLAKRLLAGTDDSIDEIVYLTGFSEPSTFYRAFKRWTGVTPIEYRRSKLDNAIAS
ncbi:AraC family transcriptional regulator [Pelagibaculum spongiae]|uniref:AraC family transcriptional regulator n=1 Tax=Pelagibaculum spongiae TaxID=2080658 RepID=A0A2V1GU01_9GAMM|nr:AraC family transcriptional regulator [Pelagibaculum spongiae]PVZ69489.1 AraC family transcriptional regulator [Pelagibaculum spongiae]